MPIHNAASEWVRELWDIVLYQLFAAAAAVVLVVVNVDVAGRHHNVDVCQH